MAFASCRSIPIGRPRPAWYHATATCTSPCRNSRSSEGAARQASSSSSCAAKYSPARISSRPASNPDADLSVGDLHVVGLELNREVELVFPGAHVVLPAMPGTGEDAVLEHALPERPLQVQAVLLHRVEAAVAMGQRDLLLAGAHSPH